jgi:hypothetical protein
MNRLQANWTVLTFAFLVFGCDREPPPTYRLELDSLRRVEQAAVLYRQEAIVRSPVAAPTALASLASGDGMAVAGAGQVAWSAGAPFRSFEGAELPEPAVAVAVATRDRVYIASQQRIYLWNPTAGGEPQAWIEFPEAAQICSLAAGEGLVWVADAGGGRVHVYRQDGELVTTVPGPDAETKAPHFILPSRHFDLAAGPDGSFWAVNPGRHRLENYRTDGSLIGSWGEAGNNLPSFAGCCNPVHIAVLGDHRFATVEKGLKRIKLYDQQGRFAGVVCGPEKLTSDGRQLDAAALAGGKLAVLDPSAGVIRIFAPSREQGGRDA